MLLIQCLYKGSVMISGLQVACPLSGSFCVAQVCSPVPSACIAAYALPFYRYAAFSCAAAQTGKRGGQAIEHSRILCSFPFLLSARCLNDAHVPNVWVRVAKISSWQK